MVLEDLTQRALREHRGTLLEHHGIHPQGSEELVRKSGFVNADWKIPEDVPRAFGGVDFEKRRVKELEARTWERA